MGRPPAAEHAGRVRVYFSNPDLLWANEFPAPRFGQGALQTALKALHQEVVPPARRYMLPDAISRQMHACSVAAARMC